jgi:LysM repeat protein
MTRASVLRVVLLALAVVLVACACQGWPFRAAVTPAVGAMEAPTETPVEATTVPTETPVPTATAVIPTEVPATNTPLPTPTATVASSTQAPTPPATPVPPAPAMTPEPTVVAVMPTATAAPLEPVYHVVQWGENLTRIAIRYGVTVQALAVANGIWNPDCVWAGLKLWIPMPGAVASQTYTVQTGDTLYSLARRFGVTVWAIAQTNGIWDVSYVQRGQVLLIPTSAPVPAPGPWARLYVVQMGDTLSGIAWRFGSTVWDIAQANAIAFPDLVYIGQRLYIP